ncbi:transporter substrate-binding domain-containing protein [Nocardioides sp.]|uniref:transporter substrate-binding domain-containing protein n=1 Tax=Nocardioides sp. TaxID=35761 RepID=UPI002C2E05DF|nr:transporter substrate-binding domain-containing protein [Nocardioides sp.]HVX55275.1 transporter substrate-binding domain-containing protein [Nocardioides sp.]
MKSKLWSRMAGAVGVVALTGAALTACGGGSSSPSSSSGTSLLNQIIKRGTLRVGIMPDSPPFGQQMSDGTFQGYDADIAKELAASLGAKVQFVALTGDSRNAALDSGRTDVDISTFSVTPQRAQSVEFTIPYTQIDSALLYKKSESITSLKQLKGKSVAVGSGTTNDTYLTEECKSVGCKVMRFDAIADAIQALKSGKVDAAMDSSFSMDQEAQADSSLAVLDPTPKINAAFIAMGVKRGDQLWLNYLNTFIETLNGSGENATLSQKWFHADVPAAIPYAQ